MIETLSLEAVLGFLNIKHLHGRLEEGIVIKLGPAGDKEKYRRAAEPKVIRPEHYISEGFDKERPSELYEIPYENGSLIVILPEKEEGYDDRKPKLMLEGELSDYLIRANIGYSGFPNNYLGNDFYILRSDDPFLTEGFKELTEEETEKFTKKMGFYFFEDNISHDDHNVRFKALAREFRYYNITELEIIREDQEPLFYLCFEEKEIMEK